MTDLEKGKSYVLQLSRPVNGQTRVSGEFVGFVPGYGTQMLMLRTHSMIDNVRQTTIVNAAVIEKVK